MLIIGKSILLIINNTRSIQNPKLLFFILIIHHVLKRTCFLIKSEKNFLPKVLTKPIIAKINLNQNFKEEWQDQKTIYQLKL